MVTVENKERPKRGRRKEYTLILILSLSLSLIVRQFLIKGHREERGDEMEIQIIK